MKISDHIISQEATLLEALNRLNATCSFTLFAVDAEERVVGSITDGDIRRALIAGVKLDDKIAGVCHRTFRFIDANNQATPKLLKEIRQSGIHLIPYIDENGRIARLIDLTKIKGLLPIDGVLMAGGRGERLQPLTDNCPKPLLPLGGKPIVEHNVDRMLSYGIDNITFSVRYLGEQIKAYFGNGEKWNATIGYVDEDAPLGTIGAVSKIDNFKNDTVLVMNSDLFTNIDLEEFYNHFIETGSDMAVASIPYNVSVPYAVMQTDDDNVVTSFQEKPTFTYYSNGGIYLIKRSVLSKLQRNAHCDATDLMQRLINDGCRVTCFPIVGYWIDIGRHEDYKKAQDFIKYTKL